MSKQDIGNLLENSEDDLGLLFFKEALDRLEHSTKIVWEPQEGPQQKLIDHLDTWEVLYGGARGSGKTDAMLGDWIHHERKYGGRARGIFIRRESVNLKDVIMRSKELFRQLGASWNGTEKQWTFPSGAVLMFAHLWDDDAASKYQGWNLTRVYAEEITHWPTFEPLKKMMATLRSAHGVACGFRATGNPGGPGHNIVKARYVDPAPSGMQPIVDPDTGKIRIFIPGKLEDNKILMDNDPTYHARLMQSGPEYLVRAWRYGDWNIVSGGFFDDVFEYDKHIYKPFPIPPSWTLRRAFDWGSSKPAAFLIFAVSDGTYDARVGHYFPPGSMILIHEWYTCQMKHGQVDPDKGLRLSNQELGLGIAQRSMEVASTAAQPYRNGTRAILPYYGCVADPAIFTSHGGPSIYEQIRNASYMAHHRLHFGLADNKRIAGWQKMRDMMGAAKEVDLESPWLCAFDTCTNFIRTVPVLPADNKNLDDVLTKSEDHVADATRYAVMSGHGETTSIHVDI